MNVTERINRILFILSCVSQNQGITVDKLADKTGMRPKQLLKELEFITLIGKPPFKPDDYIDIYVDEECVFIEFDQKLNRPLRFTRPEAMALLMSLELLDPEVDPNGVGSLKEKIEQVISHSVDPTARLEDQILLERPSRLMSDSFSMIRQAVEKRRKVYIDYYSLASNRTENRVLHPYFLMKHLGYWYLTGYCELRQDLRTFKFERILSVEPLDTSFDEPADFDVTRYQREFLQSMGTHRVEIHFGADVAPWIREQWRSAVRDHPESGVILTLYTETLEFPSRLVLGAAPHARPMSPPEFVDKVRQDAHEVAAAYAADTVTQ